jgi:hypothetical protein
MADSQTTPNPTPEFVGLARAHVSNNWARVVDNAITWAGLLILVALIAQCSTGEIW